MILEASQEHRDHGIARHIVHTPLLEEDVGLAGRRKGLSQLGVTDSPSKIPALTR